MVDVERMDSENRRETSKTNGSGGPSEAANGARADTVSTTVVGRTTRVVVSVEPADERSRVLDALSRFQGLDVHAVENLDFQAVIAAPNYDYAIVWYQALEKMRDADATALVRLSRSAKVIVALSSDRILDAAKVLHLADAWLFTDGLLDRLGLLVGLSDSGYTVVPSIIGNDFGLDGLRGDLMETLHSSERQVLGALGQGCTNRDIAVELKMSEPQTKALVRSILGKMRFRNRTEAAVFIARRHNLDANRIERRAS
jgi:DNA-binding NarL/FixJ family response regulator